jgi:methionine-rich copper-binding protein CopC
LVVAEKLLGLLITARAGEVVTSPASFAPEKSENSMLKRASLVAMTFVSLALIQTPAFAHANLKTSTPAAESVVAEVKEIRLGFSEGVNAKFSGVDLKDQTGKKVATGTAAIDPKNKRELVVPVKGNKQAKS